MTIQSSNGLISELPDDELIDLAWDLKNRIDALRELLASADELEWSDEIIAGKEITLASLSILSEQYDSELKHRDINR